MFRKQISPKATAVAVLVILAVIQIVYWRLLVYRPRVDGPPPGGGGGAGPNIVSVGGREDIDVDTYTGDGPGYQDGKLWEARFCGPNALAVGPDGALFVADSRNHRIRKISRDGQVSTVAGGGEPDGAGGRADGAADAARFRFPSGVAVDRDGVIYVSDTGNHRICRIRDGQVTTLAGGTEGKADGPAPSARFSAPAALALDAANAVWIADLGNQAVRRLDLAGQVSTPAATPPEINTQLGQVAPPAAPAVISASADGIGLPSPTEFTLGHRSPGARLSTGTAVYADTEYGVLLVNEPNAGPLLAVGRRAAAATTKGTMDGTGLRASFALPCAAVVGADGRVYVADYEANTIRQVRLPEWLQQGAAVPEGPRRGRGRMQRER